MRKSIFYLAFMALMAVGCQQELEQDNPSGTLSKVMFTAVTESSADVKTSLNQDSDNEKIYNIHWSEGDKVLVSDGNVSAEYTATPSEEDPTYASLTTTAETTPDAGAGKYYAVFPSLDGVTAGEGEYTVVIPAIQTWENGEFDMPMVGLGDSDNKIAFKNAASILKITPNNLCDSYDGVRVAKIEVTAASNIAGKVAVSYEGTGEPSFGEVTGGSNTITLDCGEKGAEFSETFYIALVPGSYDALTIKITSNGGGSQTFTLTTPEGKSYERSEYASVGVKISNLAIYETANCYLVKKAGIYKFPVTVKGNGVVVAGCSVSSSELNSDYILGYEARVISQLDTDRASIDLAKTMRNVQLTDDGFISFEIPENFTPGNVRIGVYSTDGCAEGTCLWQWHIWVNPHVSDIVVNGHSILNMNIGSLQNSNNLSAHAGTNAGLLYQWGRKDPFHPLVEYNGNMLRTIQSVLGYSVNTNCNSTVQNRATLSRSIAYPSSFYTGKQTNTADDGTKSYDRRAWYMNDGSSDDVGALLWGGDKMGLEPTSELTISKTMFDPCPPGFHVPDAKVLSDVGSELPCDGYRLVPNDDGNERMAAYGTEKYYWSASAHNVGSMNGVCLVYKTGFTGLDKQSKAYAMPIRAQKQ